MVIGMAGIATLKDNVRLYIGETETLTAENKISNINSIGDIGGEAEEIDTTTIDSIAKEFENGFEDNGSLEVTQNITDDEYAKMDTWKKAGTMLHWGLSTHNKAGEQILGLRGKGVVKSAKLTGISVGGLLQCVASIRLSGAIETDFVDPVSTP
jgi:hypothetical protein